MYHRKTNKENSQPIIRRVRKPPNHTDQVATNETSDRVKSFETTFKRGNRFIIDGPCELIIGEVDFREAEGSFILKNGTRITRVVL
jgi:hypothetical protein